MIYPVVFEAYALSHGLLMPLGWHDPLLPLFFLPFLFKWYPISLSSLDEEVVSFKQALVWVSLNT